MELHEHPNNYLYLFRRLNSLLPKDLLMTVHKAYFQSKYDHGIYVFGCTTQTNIDKIQIMQNWAVRVITGCYDFINTRGLDLVNELDLQNKTERKQYA